MTSQPPGKFLAVLIYQYRDDLYCEQPYIYTVSHPEIAYRLAVAQGEKLLEYQRIFLGLSRLEEIAEDRMLIAQYEDGNGLELLVPKAELAVFQDPKWRGHAYDENELQRELADPGYLMVLEGLNNIPWQSLEHAYGSAKDVPLNLKNLVSADAVVRDKAYTNLYISINHQGDIYSSTIPALPYLLQVLENRFLPDRGLIVQLLVGIIQSASRDLDLHQRSCDHSVDKTEADPEHWKAERPEAFITPYRNMRQILFDQVPAIRRLTSDPDPQVAYCANLAIKYLDPYI